MISNRALALLVTLLAAHLVFAQDSAGDQRTREAIDRARNTSVAKLDHTLPNVALESFLKQQGGAGAKLEWETNDCGEQTGSPSDADRDFPICAQATLTMPDKHIFTLMLAVGTYKTGIGGDPEIWYMELHQPNGSSVILKKVSDLPALLRTNHK